MKSAPNPTICKSKKNIFQLMIKRFAKTNSLFIRVPVWTFRSCTTGTSSSTKSVFCPACKSKSIEIKGDMFCCSICPNRQEVNYFKLLGLPEKYDIDVKEAETNYRSLQMSVHPDKMDESLAGQTPEGYSSLLNKAISVVKSPVERAMHLLFILDGCTVKQSELTNDSGLLMEMLELNENVDECGSDKVCLENLKRENELQLSHCDSVLKDLFKSESYTKARKECERMHYLERIRSTILKKLTITSNV